MNLIKENYSNNYTLCNEPEGIIYNGDRITDFNITDHDVNVHTLISNGATFGKNNSVSLAGKVLTGAGYAFQAIEVNNSYIAFDGNYDVGTYVDFYYTGNNMPQVMFFADEINGRMTNFSDHNFKKPMGDVAKTDNVAEVQVKVANHQGLLLTNGMYTSTNQTDYNANAHRFQIWGMNRVNFADVKTTWSATANTNAALYTVAWADDTNVDKPTNAFTQRGLNTDKYKNTEFKYTVGTLSRNGCLVVEAILYTYDSINDSWTKLTNIVLRTTIDASEYTGSIVAYATVKDAGSDTEFRYSMPYNRGVSYNEDGSVTIETSGIENFSGAGFATSVAEAYFNHINYEGDYGVGTYIEFEFIGNNLPQVMFFANNTNGNIAGFKRLGTTSATSGFNTDTITPTGDMGLLLNNGFYNGPSNANNGGKNYFWIWGMNRYLPSTINTGVNNVNSGCLKRWVYNGVYGALTQTTLMSTYSETKLRYLVGTYSDGDSVVVDITLSTIDKDTGVVTKLFNATCDTGISDDISGNIIVFATAKGDNQTSTFTITKEPYLKNN